MLVRWKKKQDDYYADMWRERCARHKCSPNAVYSATPVVINGMVTNFVKVIRKDGLRLITCALSNFEIISTGLKQKKLGDYL